MDDSFQSHSIINEENRGTSTTGSSFREWRLIYSLIFASPFYACLVSFLTLAPEIKNLPEALHTKSELKLSIKPNGP